jgi:catechol 2,3-dioxygenase-like lactoylglutathione lyase family enzyme
MQLRSLNRLFPAILLGASLAAGSASAAELGAAANGVKLTKYIIGVADLDKTYAFYHALGLDSQRPIGKPAQLADQIRQLVAVPAGTSFRNTMLSIPGSEFPLEVTEFSGMQLNPGRPRAFDPGAGMLILIVRDVNAALAAAKQAGGEVITAGGAPLAVGPNNANRAVFVKDPDNFIVELLQPGTLQATTAPATSNIIGARFGSIVENAEKAANFYRDRFGLEAKVNDYNSNENILKLSGLTSGKMRNATVTVPGSTLTWSFFEFKVPGAKAYKLRVPDPGAPAVGFEVHDLAAGSAAMKANGGEVVTNAPDGRLVMGNGNIMAFTRDPNGILVELAQPGKK